MAQPQTHVSAAETPGYVDWPAIFAGAVLSVAVGLVLLAFGTGMGLSIVSPEPGEGATLRWITIAAGIWFIWVVISSNVAGAYMAGRLRRRANDASPDESDTRDGAHGLIVWAVGAILAAMLAANGVTGVVRTATSAAGTATEAVSGAVGDQIGYFANLVQRGPAPADAPDVTDQISTVLTRSLAEGEVSASDRDYLIELVAERVGVPPAEVTDRVDAALGQFEQAQEAAVEAANQARVAGVIAAFVAAATMLIAAAAAYFAAVAGGDHRDRNLAFRNILK